MVVGHNFLFFCQNGGVTILLTQTFGKLRTPSEENDSPNDQLNTSVIVFLSNNLYISAEVFKHFLSSIFNLCKKSKILSSFGG